VLVYTEVHFGHTHAVHDLRLTCRNLPTQTVAERTSDPPFIEFSTMSLTVELHPGLIRTMNLTQSEGVRARLAHRYDFIPHVRTMHLTMKVTENFRTTN